MWGLIPAFSAVALGCAASAAEAGTAEAVVVRAGAVEGRALPQAREGDPHREPVSLDRFERLAMGGPASADAAPDSVEAESKPDAPPGGSRLLPESFFAERAKERQGRMGRIVRKVGSGALGGVLVGLGGIAAGAALGAEDCGSSDGDDPWCGVGSILGALLFGTTGYTVGAAIGVSRVDPHDRFILALAGSAAGAVAGGAMVGDPFRVESWGEFWPLFPAPVAFATLVSELTRSPHEDLRRSLRPSPHPGRGGWPRPEHPDEVGGPSGEAARDSVGADSRSQAPPGGSRLLPKGFLAERAKERQGRKMRIARKLGSGALWGTLGAWGARRPGGSWS